MSKTNSTQSTKVTNLINLFVEFHEDHDLSRGISALSNLHSSYLDVKRGRLSLTDIADLDYLICAMRALLIDATTQAIALKSDENNEEVDNA